MKLTLLFSYLLIIFTNSDSDQDKDKNDTLKTYYFAATTVTATRIKQPIKDVALTTIVIDRNQIDKTLPVDVPEAIRQYPGIDIFHYGGPGALSSISIRGVMSNGILVLKDGRPVNSILTGNCDLSSLNLNEIERIEIVKGPTSSFYGANGLGGVVNFISEKEIKGLEISLKNRLGLYSFQENYIDLNIPINKLTTRLSGNLITSDGIRSNSDYLNKYISGHIKYANPKIDLNSIFSYNWRDLGVPGPKPYKNSIPLFGDSTASSLFDREKDKIWMATVRGEFRPTAKIGLETNLYADRRDIQFHTQYSGFMNDTIIEDYNWLVHTIGVNINGSINLNRIQIISGVDFRYDSLRTVKETNQPGDTNWSPASITGGGWFATNIAPHQKVHLTPSIRYDHNLTYGNFVSPQLGLVFHLQDWLRLKGSAGRAFRTPTFNDLYLPVYGNSKLRPEYGNSFEAGFELNSDYRFSILFTAYEREIKDRIAWQPDKGGIYKPININFTTIRGFEMASALALTGFLKTEFNLTLQKGRQRNRELIYSDWLTDSLAFATVERDLAYTPDILSNWRNTLELPGKITSVLNISYTGRRKNYYEDWSYTPNIFMRKKTLKPYFLLDVSISKSINDYILFSTGLKNILNEQYTVQFGSTIIDRDYPMPGRQIFIEIQTHYRRR